MGYINKVKNDLNQFHNYPDYTLKSIRKIISAIEESIKENEDENMSVEDITANIYNFINDSLFKHNSPTRSDLYLFKTLESMVKNPNVIKDILISPKIKKILNPSNTNFTYTSNIDENYITILTDSFVILQKQLPKDLIDKLEKNELNINELKIVQNEIQKFLKDFHNKFFNKVIKEGYIKKVNNFAKILDFTGNLEEMNNYNNFRVNTVDLNFLGYSYSYSKTNKPIVTSLMDYEYVKNHYNIDELIAMCAFYANKVAKVVQRYNSSLYIIYKTDLIKKYKENPDYTFNLSDKEIIKILQQQSILTQPARDFIKDKTNSITSKKYEITDNTIYEELNNPIIKQTLRDYDNDYLDEFRTSMPKYKHDILSDLNQSIMLESSTVFAYKAKHHAIECLLSMLIDKQKERNWGIILDRQNMKKNNDPNILLGIDMKEFNMPIRLHCAKEIIENFLTNYTGKPLIPIYKGFDDMFRESNTGETYHSTTILLKLTKEQRQLLRKKAETISKKDRCYKFVKHLQWMSHPKRPPEYLLNENGKFTKQYYDLKSNKIYDEKYLEKHDIQR